MAAFTPVAAHEYSPLEFTACVGADAGAAALEAEVIAWLPAALQCPPAAVSIAAHGSGHQLRLEHYPAASHIHRAVERHRVVRFDAGELRSTTDDPAGGDVLGLPVAARLNFDEELWGMAASDAAQAPVRATCGGDVTVGQLAAYVEKHVDYVGAYDDQGALNPLFVCVALLAEARATPRDLLVLLRHTSRYVRCLALWFVRYAFPPEHAAVYFGIPAPGEQAARIGLGLPELPLREAAVLDRTVVQLGQDGETGVVAHFALKLLLEDEVLEAWLPTWAPFATKALTEQADRAEALANATPPPAAAATGSKPAAAAARTKRPRLGSVVLPGFGTVRQMAEFASQVAYAAGHGARQVSLGLKVEEAKEKAPDAAPAAVSREEFLRQQKQRRLERLQPALAKAAAARPVGDAAPELPARERLPGFHRDGPVTLLATPRERRMLTSAVVAPDDVELVF